MFDHFRVLGLAILMAAIFGVAGCAGGASGERWEQSEPEVIPADAVDDLSPTVSHQLGTFLGEVETHDVTWVLPDGTELSGFDSALVAGQADGFVVHEVILYWFRHGVEDDPTDMNPVLTALGADIDEFQARFAGTRDTLTGSASRALASAEVDGLAGFDTVVLRARGNAEEYWFTVNMYTDERPS